MVTGAVEPNYKVVEGWGVLPRGWSFTQIAGVAVDHLDNVYVFNRGLHPVIIFDEEGNFLNSWGEGVFGRPHGIYIGEDRHVYCADDGDHTIRKLTLDGELLFTIGTKDKPGADGDPFNRPTGVAVSPLGDI